MLAAADFAHKCGNEAAAFDVGLIDFVAALAFFEQVDG